MINSCIFWGFETVSALQSKSAKRPSQNHEVWINQSWLISWFTCRFDLKWIEMVKEMKFLCRVTWTVVSQLTLGKTLDSFIAADCLGARNYKSHEIRKIRLKQIEYFFRAWPIRIGFFKRIGMITVVRCLVSFKHAYGVNRPQALNVGMRARANL